MSIFIAYRRDDGGHARALYEKLRDWFDADQVFLDHENLDPGARFRPELEKAIEDCTVFLAVIGPHWLSDRNRQRLQDPDDVTRGEIRTAIAHQKILIPVLAGGAGFPDAKLLPADISAMSEDNAHHQLEAQYRASFQKLLDALQHRYGLKPEYRRRDGSRQPFHTNRELPSPHFADPTAKLPKLHRILAQGGSAALTAATVQGMGGVGKTQLALKYSHAFRDEYEGVWWFRADEGALLEQDSEELCRERDIPRYGEEPYSQSAARWLKSQPRWLLVYDNADDPEAVRPHLPEGSVHHVLVTSRNPHWGGIVKGGQLDLETWSDGEALEFLNSRLEDISEDQLRSLSRALGGLPLALEMAAAYLEQNGRDVEGYLAGLTDMEEVPRLLDRSHPANGYPHGVLAALSLAFDKLSPAARELLGLCGWLAPEAIPERLFTGHPEALPGKLASAAAKPGRWNETVGILEHYALCQRFDIPSLDADAPKGKTEKALQLHRLTQEAVRAKPGESGNPAAVIGLLRVAFPAEHNNPKFWPTQAALLPHVQGLARFAGMEGFDLGLYSWLLDRGAAYLRFGSALYPEARRLFERALEIDRRVQGEDHPDTLSSMNNLAETLYAQGDLPGARALQEKALEVRRRVQGEEHPDTLTSMNNLANTLYAQGDLPGARALHEKALEVRRRVLGEDHLATLTSMSNLANTLYAQGDLPGARALQEKALEARRRVLGEDHPSTSISAFNLLRILEGQGNGERAGEIFRDHLAWLLERDPDTLGADQRTIRERLQQWLNGKPQENA